MTASKIAEPQHMQQERRMERDLDVEFPAFPLGLVRSDFDLPVCVSDAAPLSRASGGGFGRRWIAMISLETERAKTNREIDQRRMRKLNTMVATIVTKKE